MSLEIVRRIRGNVHGTIDVTALEDAIISHDYVQRLRRIKQLAFLHFVFPGASHTRFEHSLGVMQLAGIAWDKLKVNQRRIAENAGKIVGFSGIEKKKTMGIIHGLLSPTFTLMSQVFDSDYNLQVLRLAGLLHDIGHPPFSHSGERFITSWADVLAQNQDQPDYIRDWLQESIDKIIAKGDDPSKVTVRHEVYSLLLMDKVIRDTYRDFPDLKVEIEPRDVISVIEPSIKPSPNSPLLANGIYTLLHELISAELDIDRMDYLLRDSRECGVVYGIFDAGRILDGLCIYQDNVDKSLHVAISHSGLAAFEDYLRARQSMYLQVYFHKTSSSAEAMMQYLAKLLGGWTLPANASAYAEFDEYNIGGELKRVGDEYIKDIYIKSEFERILKDLLYRRKLWKRVYETNGLHDDVAAQEKMAMVKEIIADEDFEFEQVSSLTSLTRFRGRSKSERSKNYLRLIVKDEFQVPRVVPIEDYAAVVRDNSKVLINRIYVDGGSNNSGQSIASIVKEKIHKKFRSILK